MSNKHSMSGVGFLGMNQNGLMPTNKSPDNSLVQFINGKMDVSKYFQIKKNWGSESWIVNNQLYCMKILNVNEGKMCSVHYHKEKDETFFMAAGNMKLELWHNYGHKTFEEDSPDNMMYLWGGMSIRILPNTAHRFTGLKGGAQFIEVSTTHKEEDSYRIIPSPA